MNRLQNRLRKLESQVRPADLTGHFDRIRRWRLALLEDPTTLNAVRDAAVAGNQVLARRITDEFVAKYEANYVAG
jgi:hypothetical protein